MTYHEAVFRAARLYWRAQLRAHKGNVRHAAKASGTDRKSTYKILRTLSLSPEAFRPHKPGHLRGNPSTIKAYATFVGLRSRPHMINIATARIRERRCGR